MIKLGVIGFGYWGPNLVRNFMNVAGCVVKTVVDNRAERLAVVQNLYPGIQVSTKVEAATTDPDIDAVVIALPVSAHYYVGRQALLNGKHVLIEKPMTGSEEEAMSLIDIADQRQKVLMVDHTYLYTGAVKKMKELISNGEIGRVEYFDSVRINLGLFRRDVSVLWDLAPHDISILSYLIDETPYSVSASGISHTGNGIENIAYLTLNYSSNLIAHVNTSWTSPVKIRKILIGGTKKMIVYDDLEPTEKIRIYDSGYLVNTLEEENRILVDYRIGDIYVPKVDATEALKGVAADFVQAIGGKTAPISDWKQGLDVVRVLAAAEKSIKNRGQEVRVHEDYQYRYSAAIS